MTKTVAPARIAYSFQETADMLGVSLRHIYTIVDDGQLASFRSGRRRLINVEEIDRYRGAS